MASSWTDASATAMDWEVRSDIKNGIGWFANLMTLFFVLAPIKDIRIVLRNKNTDNLVTAFPYFSALFNGLVWTAYQLPEWQEYIPALLLNAIGSTFMITYISIYWYYCSTKEERRNCIYYLLGCLAYLIGAVILQLLKGRQASGYAAAAINVVMYYAPLIAAREVLRTGSVARMPFLPTLFLLFSSSSWFTFAVYSKDTPMIIPNGLGCLLSLLQITIYLWVYSRMKSEVNMGGSSGFFANGTRDPEAAIGTVPYRLGSMSNIAEPLRTEDQPEVSSESDNSEKDGGEVYPVTDAVIIV